MNNDLGSLNNYLFEQLERLNDDETLETEENFKKEILRSKAIANISKSIIDNANTILEAKKYAQDYGVKNVSEVLKIGNVN